MTTEVSIGKTFTFFLEYCFDKHFGYEKQIRTGSGMRSFRQREQLHEWCS